MKRTVLLIVLIAALIFPANTEPWGGAQITVTAGTAIRLVKNRTIAQSLSFQMHSGGSGRGYVLFAPSGVTCANGGAGTTLLMELNAATANSAGGSGVVPMPGDPQGGPVDVSLYCVDGSNSGDVITVAWNLR